MLRSACLLVLMIWCGVGLADSVEPDSHQGLMEGFLSVPSRMPSPTEIDYLSGIIVESYSLSRGHADFIALHVSRAAYYYAIRRDVIIALIKVESGFNPAAISKKDARGYTQVVPKWWDVDSPHNIYSPSGNIYAGAFILDRYRDKLSNIDHAIKAYNVGIKNFTDDKYQGSAKKYHSLILKELYRIRGGAVQVASL